MQAFDPDHKTVVPRLREAVRSLASREWKEARPIPPELLCEGPDHRRVEEVDGLSGRPIKLPHRWGKVFDQAWFRLRLPEVEDEGWWLRWRDQGEATLYIDGKAFAGYDVAHREFELPKTSGDFLVASLCCQTAIWHPEAKGLDPDGARIDECSLLRRDPLCRRLRTDFTAALQVVEEFLRPLDGNYGRGAGLTPTPDLHGLELPAKRMIARLYEILNDFDRDRLEDCAAALDAFFQRFHNHPEDGRVALTGHAHVDLVWLWPERVGVQKALHSMATADYLLERYPEFRFGYSQPASYRAVEAVAPELVERIRKRLTEGRWEAAGALWVESDTWIACGEALIRSFLLGQQWFERETGRHSGVVWLPDCFGFSVNFPQIARLAGARYFFTMKTGWRMQDLFPYTSFRWSGADGSELLAHCPRNCRGTFYNGKVEAEEIRFAMARHPQGTTHPELLVPTGYGDGGGGPTEEHIRIAERLDGFYGLPALKWDRIDRFFERMAGIADKLPVCRGEISIQNHRGTFTSHHSLKARFRAAERALQTWEAARVATGGAAIPTEAWERLTFAQFHDYVPGSSIAEVYVEALAELDALAGRALEAAQAELSAPGGEDCRFNPLPEPLAIRLDAGTGQPCRAVLPPLAGLSVAELRTARTVSDPALSADALHLRNERLEARFNASGEVDSLRLDGVPLPAEGPLNQLWIGVDKPYNFKAWNVDASSWESSQRFDKPAACVGAHADASEASVCFERRWGESLLRSTYRLPAGASRIEVDLEVDWKQPERIVRAVFPTPHRLHEASFGAPCGVVRRSQQPGAPESEAGWETPASRWGFVGDPERGGLFVASESKYGFCARDGLLALSLFRSCAYTGAEGEDFESVVAPGLRRLDAAANYADIGRFTVRYAFGPVGPGLPHPASAAATAFTAPLAYRGPPRPGPDCLDRLAAAGLQAEWALPAGGGWILRAYELRGRRGCCDVSPARPQAWLDFFGRKKAPASSSIEFRPYEILSLRFAD